MFIEGHLAQHQERSYEGELYINLQYLDGYLSKPLSSSKVC